MRSQVLDVSQLQAAAGHLMHDAPEIGQLASGKYVAPDEFAAGRSLRAAARIGYHDAMVEQRAAGLSSRAISSK